MKEYPDSEDLEKIEKWDTIHDPFGLVKFMESICWRDAIRIKGKKVWRVEFHTWGWSGNEDIINALRRNLMFFTIYWQRSIRGGHYYFKVYKLK
jgi:hypothetical protein